jgi:excinuclease ABC subunit C
MDKTITDTIKEKLNKLPRRAGVYLMKDERGKVLYVGKAVDLRQRVRSYFQKGQHLSAKVRAMVDRIRDLDYTVTDTEVEALILESNLIKEFRPRYNIDLKDDKQYPYLKITVQELFPRIVTTRRVEKDGARYFGPYTDTGAVRETVRLIRRLFPLRHCRKPIDPKKELRPCLNRDIKRCLAPCSAAVTPAEYRKVVDQVLLFLEGKQDKLLRELTTRMTEAAENLHFEKAAHLRDQYRAVQAVTSRQKIVSADGRDRDVLALVSSEEEGCVQLFTVRGGKLTGREHFLVTNPTGEAPPELMGAFIRQYYSTAGDIPGEIILSDFASDKELLEQWLLRRRGRPVRLHVPQRGEKRELVRLACDNARLFLEQEELREKARDPRVALQSLSDVLALGEPPYRIEGYDISHLHGEGTVAAMVVFQGGLPLPRDYRRFRMRTVNKPDDYASLREALTRRFARLAAVRYDSGEYTEDPFLIVPDLLLIDGGPGQLNTARQVLETMGFDSLPVVSLAKEEELLFLAGGNEPLSLPAISPALQLMQRVRDEAHRYVHTYQRTQRKGAQARSVLLDVPGIGEKRRKALLKHFGSLDAVRRASLDELAAVKSMNGVAAARLFNFFHGNRQN